MTEHMPTPWTYDPRYPIAICDRSGIRIMIVTSTPFEESDFNKLPKTIEFIVRAVNAHDEMLAALKAVREESAYKDGPTQRTWATLYAAIDKAEGR